MPYEPFQNVQSGLNNTIKGLIKVDEDGARAFMYRKNIIVRAFLDTNLPGISYKDLAGQWKVRIRENGLRENGEPDGAYIGAILFEQTVTWTARIVVWNLGPFVLVTWQPLGDAGSGKQETSIVDRNVYATVADINDPAQAEAAAAYGENGAWKRLDLANVNPNDTPKNKYNAELGFSDFTSESVYTIGGYNFFASWISAAYITDFKDGAILETVFDNWQNAQPTEALYEVSVDKGIPNREGALFDERCGQRFWLYSETFGENIRTYVYRSRQALSPMQYAEAENAGEMVNKALRGGNLTRLGGGAMLATGVANGRLMMFITHDEALNWEQIMDQPIDITPLASCMLADRARYAIYGKTASGAAAYVLLKHEASDANGNPKNAWSIAESGRCEGQELPITGISSMEEGEGGVLRIMTRDTFHALLRVLISTDGGKTYEDEQVVAR